MRKPQSVSGDEVNVNAAHPVRTAAAGALLVLLAGCQTAPPAEKAASSRETETYRFPADAYRDIAPEEGTVYRLDPRASTVRILVYRGGTLSKVGHNHVIVPGKLRGAVLLPPGGSDGARLDVEMPLESLQVDPPRARGDIGGSFSAPVDDDARQGTREHMLGKDTLDAQRFPVLGLRVRQMDGELPRPILQADIVLHGRSHRVAVPARVEVSSGTLEAEGRFAVRQTWFGIEPFTALGGALRVQDWLMVEFDIVARRGP